MKLDIPKIDLTKLNLEEKKIIQIAAALFLLIVLVVDLVLLLPLTAEIKHIQEEQKIQVSEIDFSQGLLTKERTIEALRVISQENLNELIDKMIVLGRKKNVEVSVSDSLGEYKKQKKNSLYAQKIMTMDIVGSFQNVGLFLTALKNMNETVLDLKSINLNRQGKDLSKVQAHITILLFATKDNESK